MFLPTFDVINFKIKEGFQNTINLIAIYIPVFFFAILTFKYLRKNFKKFKYGKIYALVLTIFGLFLLSVFPFQSYYSIEPFPPRGYAPIAVISLIYFPYVLIHHKLLNSKQNA